MSKYKPLDEPITRREACSILDRKHFDGLVRAGHIKPVGKRGVFGTIGADGEDGVARTAPLLFDQQEVRVEAGLLAVARATEAKLLRFAAKKCPGHGPFTRRQINALLGSRLTGILIRSGELTPSGKLTDTQTAAHTFDPTDVALLIDTLADDAYAESRALTASAKKRVPA